ncbi:MAG: hypothetical protein WA964_16485 [Ilumatobacter sp.]|uniref:hypothetical protein n=1 Tax=Ilumatobacter sp. TaxID=1967498 RepID=UPI003C792002
MVGRREPGGETEDLASPWATGDVAAGPAPEFAWEQPDAAEHDEPAVTVDHRRRNQALIAVGCVVALVIGTVALWPRSDPPTDASDVGDRPETTLGTLPDANEDDGQEEGEAADSGSDSTDANADGVLAPGPDVAGGDATSIELPDRVAAITEPTEIVLTVDGEIITVSLPSGSVRRVPADGSLGSGVIVAPDGAAWSTGTKLNIVPRNGPARSVDLEVSANGGVFPSDWFTGEAGTTLFLVNTFTQNENQQYTVSLDGEVEEYEPTDSQLDPFAFASGLRRRGSDEIVNDAGGVYVIGPDGVERISTGRALAATDGFVLLRECDEALDCSHLVLDRVTGERRASPVTSEQLSRSSTFDLSPDGSATLAFDFQSGERRLIDLDDGTVVATLPVLNSFNGNMSWAADSSGYFDVDMSGTGLTFVDRTSGESVPFATELGRINGLGVRTPDAELEATEDVVATRPFTFSAAPSGPTGLDVVVLGDLGTMAHLDLDSSTASVWTVPATTGSNPPDLVTIDDEIVVLPGGRSDGFVSDFGSTRPLELPEDVEIPDRPRLPGSEPGVVWSPRDGRTDGVDHQVVAVSDGVTAADVGGEVKLANSELLGEDGRGRLVARVGGDVFVVAVIGTTRLTDGELLALGPDHALTRTCDAELRCTVDRVERTTGEVLAIGERSPEFAQVLDQARPVLGPGRSPRLSGTISPDGSAALVRSAPAGDADEWIFVDFDTGRHFVVPEPADDQPVIWSEGSRAATYVSDASVFVIERATERALLIDELGEVRSIAAVGSDFAG